MAFEKISIILIKITSLYSFKQQSVKIIFASFICRFQDSTTIPQRKLLSAFIKESDSRFDWKEQLIKSLNALSDLEFQFFMFKCLRLVNLMLFSTLTFNAVLTIWFRILMDFVIKFMIFLYWIKL